MIVIDAEMPKNCKVCFCLRLGEYQAFEKSSCALNSKILIKQNKRPKDCPLKS